MHLDELRATDVECSNVPSIGIFKKSGKCYLEIEVGTAKKTTSSVKGSAVRWSEAFHL